MGAKSSAATVGVHAPVRNELSKRLLGSYVSEVLVDAQDYANHAGHQLVDPRDVKLAVEARLEKGAQPIPRQELLRLAKRKNAQPLPALPFKYPGVLLPPDEYCLIKENYQVVPRTVS